MLIEFLTSRFSYILDGGLGIAAYSLWLWVDNKRRAVSWDEQWEIIKKSPEATSAFFRTRNLTIAVLLAGLAIAGAIQ